MRKLMGVALLAVACAPALVWTKPGGSDQDFSRDKYQCAQESRTSWSGGGTGYAGRAAIANARREAEQQSQEFFDMCMRARGWRLVEDRPDESRAPPPPPPPPENKACLRACDERDLLCRRDFEARSCDGMNANCYADCRQRR